MDINKALKTEYYRPHQLIKHEHICIYLFINCFWIDIWISSLLNWYLCKFACCHLHCKTPSNFEHLETSPGFAIPTSPSKPRSITHGTVSDCNSSTEKRRRHCGGGQFEEPKSQKTSMYMRYLSQTPKEVKESWHISDKRIRGEKK